jgi:hypothetical protein
MMLVDVSWCFSDRGGVTEYGGGGGGVDCCVGLEECVALDERWLVVVVA